VSPIELYAPTLSKLAVEIRLNLKLPRYLLSFGPALLLGACASAPKLEHTGFNAPVELSPVRQDKHARVDRYVQPSALAAASSIGLPRVLMAADPSDPGISAEQGALVANRAARDLCSRLSRYFLIDVEGYRADLTIELQPIGMRATGRGAAGVSALAGLVVPGPFRLPAGLGGLAMATRVTTTGGVPALVETWSRGANPITDSAQISAIGDAYQLAGTYARELARVMIEAGYEKSAPRSRLDKDQVDANTTLCKARFGAASIAGRGAAWLLPLAPEAIDAGSIEPSTGQVGDGSQHE
jgi:hypothetical protein